MDIVDWWKYDMGIRKEIVYGYWPRHKVPSRTVSCTVSRTVPPGVRGTSQWPSDKTYYQTTNTNHSLPPYIPLPTDKR